MTVMATRERAGAIHPRAETQSDVSVIVTVVERPEPLTGSARDRVAVPYEALVEIRTCIAEVMGVLPSSSPA